MDARRFWVPVFVIVVVVVVRAPTAHAALFLVFETKSYQPDQYKVPNTGGIGSPGDLVRARTGGRGTVDPGEVMPAFLASGDYPSTIESPNDLERIEGLTLIGELRTGANGNGRLTFETPELPSGEYEIILYCSSCAAFSEGHNVVPVAPFRITGSVTDSRTSSDNSALPPWIALVFILGLVVAFVFLRRRTSRRAVAEEVALGKRDDKRLPSSRR